MQLFGDNTHFFHEINFTKISWNWFHEKSVCCHQIIALFFLISKHALYAWRAAHVLNLRPISSVFLPTVDTRHREAKVILALLMEGYSNFSISLLTTWNMSPPTLLKESVFPGPPRHHHTFKKLKKLRLNYLQLVHYLFLMAKGFNSWALWRRKYLGLVVFWGTKMSNLGFFMVCSSIT